MTTTTRIPSTHLLAPGHHDGDGCRFPSAPGHLIPVDPLAQILMPGAPVHHGVHVAELGEDGDSYGLPGHVPARRAVAAILRHLRVDCGYTVRDVRDFWLVATPRVKHSWVIADNSHPDDPRWIWTLGYDRHSLPITVVDL